MPGAFGLTTPADLLRKLSRELDRLRATPNDVDTAFNFFVTAEHLPDWLHPGDGGKAQRRAIREAEPLLQVVSHLASGAKHFDMLSPHHRSVTWSGKGGGFFASRMFASRMFAARFFGRVSLQVSLDGPAANQLGSSTRAIELAEQVYAYWSAVGRVPG
ncbi:MAG: hypothetical protein V1912_10605 [bacterium]